MPGEWLSTKEVMDTLHVSRSTLHRLITDGRLQPHKRVGSNENVFRAADVDALREPLPKDNPGTN